jgi:hypothetical protein
MQASLGGRWRWNRAAGNGRRAQFCREPEVWSCVPPMRTGVLDTIGETMKNFSLHQAVAFCIAHPGKLGRRMLHSETVMAVILTETDPVRMCWHLSIQSPLLEPDENFKSPCKKYRQITRLFDCAGKRSRDRESSPGEGDRPHNSKTTRLPDSQSGQKSSLQVLLKVQVSKQGQPVDVLTIPSLRPYQRCIFGRGPDADVKLEHASLSRAHAQLSVDRDGAVTLLDLGSGMCPAFTASTCLHTWDSVSSHAVLAHWGDDLWPCQRCIIGWGLDADLKLEHASLSQAHAQLSVDRDGAVMLLDLCSGCTAGRRKHCLLGQC